MLSILSLCDISTDLIWGTYIQTPLPPSKAREEQVDEGMKVDSLQIMLHFPSLHIKSTF